MAATSQQKSTVLNMLKQAGLYLSALNTALSTPINAVGPISTADELQAAVDAYNAARSNNAQYGGIQMPGLAATDALAAVKAEADGTP